MGLLPNPYGRFREQNLTLSDYLAIDRTVLANERTLLAYGRTAMALAVVGGSCIKFFESNWVRIPGVVLIVGGILLAARGWYRYRATKRLLASALRQETGAAEHPLEEEVNSAPEQGSRTAGSEVSPPPT
jgi:putative membrane protein